MMPYPTGYGTCHNSVISHAEMKNHYKHILILILLIVGCKNPMEDNNQQNHKEIATGEPNKEVKSFDTLCIDTIKLNSLEVKHFRIKNDKEREWVLSKRIEFQQINLKSIDYYFSARSKTKCLKPINYFYLDSLKLELKDSKIQTIQLSEFESGSTLEKLAKPNSKLIDLNFDGIMDFDLALTEVSGATNELRRYFIYNPIKEQFEEGIDIANVGLDTLQKLIYNSWSGGHTGKISTRIWSKISNYDELKTVKEIKSDFSQELDSYIVKTSEIKNDGKYSIKIDTIKRQ